MKVSPMLFQAARRLAIFAFAGILVLSSAARGVELVTVPELGVRLAPGFQISLHAGPDLANDIYAMTLDSQGRVVVTSQGWIKTLHDNDGDGRADSAGIFAQTKTGGMGLCFEGNDLYFCGDGALWRFRDADGNGQADGPPEKLLTVRYGEHGGHAMRKGPDGWIYFIGGNDSQLSAGQITETNSPVPEPMMGAIFRMSPDGKQIEAVAHGFRNPYDFDFNSAGDLFTYDSDVERDYFLPWYTPTRVYHVGVGGHHGWQLPGHQRSWNRPDFYADVVDALWFAGRGSPTGVACYRHKQFPRHYQDGLFICDWTFGRIFFCALRPNATTYQTEPEVFLEPIGTDGFAPTDVCVAPDGSLFVAIGGRRTRGAVFRIEAAGEKSAQPARVNKLADAEASVTLEAVLDAPQPLDAWSRSKWEPAARALGAAAFKSAVLNEKFNPARRVRAVEICTEFFGGLETARAVVAARAKLPQVRARVAWSAGRAPGEDPGLVLLPLAQDSYHAVRQAALEAILQQAHRIDSAKLADVLRANFAFRDKRIRQLAAQIAARLPEAEWKQLWTQTDRAGSQVELTSALAALWRGAGSAAPLRRAANVLEFARDEDLLLQALRLIMIASGDYNLHKPSVELYTAFEFPRPFADEAMAQHIRAAVHNFFPGADGRVNAEAARVLAMVGDTNNAILPRLTALITPESSPTSDMHFLIALSRLGGALDGALSGRLAEAVLDLDRKLSGRQQRTKQTWTQRLEELAAAFARRDARFSEALMKHPAFATANHVTLVKALPAVHQADAARLFFKTAQSDANFIWSPALVEVLSTLPLPEIKPLLRAHAHDFAVRDDIVPLLAKQPEPADRQTFLLALASNRPDTVRAALAALTQLPRDEQPGNLTPLASLLQRLFSDAKASEMREQTVALFARQAGRDFNVKESGADSASLRKAYEPLLAWLAAQHPEHANALPGQDGDEPAQWRETLRSVDWTKGDAGRGAAIFQQRACQSCHASASSLGPDLSGAAARFSPEDLFATIVWPNRDVAPPYRTIVFQMRDGQVHTGVVAFESADGYIVQTDAATTLRLAEPDILSRKPGDASLMPSGLLAGLKADDLADLYAYLKSLKAPQR